MKSPSTLSRREGRRQLWSPSTKIGRSEAQRGRRTSRRNRVRFPSCALEAPGHPVDLEGGAIEFVCKAGLFELGFFWVRPVAAVKLPVE